MTPYPLEDPAMCPQINADARNGHEPHIDRSDALRALAEAATPGPWNVHLTIHGDPFVCEGDRQVFGTIATVSTAPNDYGKANATYIAAVDPPTVLALLAELDAQAVELAALRQQLELQGSITHQHMDAEQALLESGRRLLAENKELRAATGGLPADLVRKALVWAAWFNGIADERPMLTEDLPTGVEWEQIRAAVVSDPQTKP